ncbi:PE domain-containing protein [Gordonia crocea]|uniref:PE domain-containing protein n=1 Tax=Gordonia crocea TaxID=589162 RepID=A0A7I9V2P0_9ACTN|nr:PE domain-containing protein [Gordonia crocea]GED99486.1 hypothetical protein nbrc107697_35250 [Gordonia crocea]
MTSNLHADPDGMAVLAGRIEEIAGRLHTMVTAGLAPPPSGRDEVSRAVSDAVGRAAREIERDLADGAREARAFAAALREQAGAIGAADDITVAPTG